MYAGVTRSAFLARKLRFTTRRYITSGGKEYVPDGRPGQHSPFMRRLLEALRSYGGSDGILTLGEIQIGLDYVVPGRKPYFRVHRLFCPTSLIPFYSPIVPLTRIGSATFLPKPLPYVSTLWLGHTPATPWLCWVDQARA